MNSVRQRLRVVNGRESLLRAKNSNSGNQVQGGGEVLHLYHPQGVPKRSSVIVVVVVLVFVSLLSRFRSSSLSFIIVTHRLLYVVVIVSFVVIVLVRTAEARTAGSTPFSSSMQPLYGI